MIKEYQKRKMLFYCKCQAYLTSIGEAGLFNVVFSYSIELFLNLHSTETSNARDGEVILLSWTRAQE